jgi:hypothetical protein
MPTLIQAAMEIVHDRDPREVIWDEVTPYIDGVRIGGPDVLVAVYDRSGGRTKVGGLLLPDRKKDDDRIESVSGLVLKLGPLAYNIDKTRRWFATKDGDPDPPKVGDWVMFDVKVSFPFMLGPRTCRLITDQYVRGVIARPDVVE